MTTATAPAPEVREYLNQVRGALHDLPQAERDDLLAEVEVSLLDAAAEGGSLVARLGPPTAFAAELRSAAGLHEAGDRRRPEWLARIRALAEHASRHPAVAPVRGLVRELAPIGWVVRGYLVVALVTFAIDATWSSRLPFVPNGFGTAATGVAFILLAVAASVVLGLLTRGTAAASILGGASVVLALASLPALGEAFDASGQRNGFSPVAAATEPPTGLTMNGVRVDNIYPYSREGELLHDVLLYDGAGRPLEIPGDPVTDPTRRFVVTNGNDRLFNVFPIRYYEPGTKRVARPNAAPYIEHPLVLTPPLMQEQPD